MKTHKFNKADREIIESLYKDFQPPVNINSVNFYWFDSYRNALGLFKATEPDNIYIKDIDIEIQIAYRETIKSYLGNMIGTINHELTHLKQRREMGLFKYSILAVPIVRHQTIEKEAEANERLAEIHFNKTQLNEEKA